LLTGEHRRRRRRRSRRRRRRGGGGGENTRCLDEAETNFLFHSLSTSLLI